MANTRNTPPQPAASPLAEYSFDNIDVAAFDTLLKEQAELQTAYNNKQPARASPANQAPVQQPRLFNPTSVTTAQNKSATGSIADDAKIMLTMLHVKAQYMRNETDCEQTSWGSSDEDERLYFNAHHVKITLAESGLQDERFHAAGELIETVMFRYTSLALDKHAVKDETLNMQCQHGSEQFQVQARHSNKFMMQNRYQYKSLPAPISKAPFDAVVRSVDELMKLVFSSWLSDTKNSNLLMRRFPSQVEAITFGALLYDIEKACKEIDKDFTFNRNSSSEEDTVIVISRNSLEKAEGLLLKDNSARFLAKMRR